MDSTCLTTPVGALSIVVHDDGAIAAAGFCPVCDLETRLGTDTRPRAELGAVTRSVSAYIAGDPGALDAPPVRQPGTTNQQRVWAALRDIAPGTTVSYGGLAGRLGLSPGASRAVGSACGRNLVAPFIPCHRVVRGGGGLGGYYYGLEVKAWLLAHESAAVAGATVPPPRTLSPAS